MVKANNKVVRKSSNDLRSSDSQKEVRCASCGVLIGLSTHAEVGQLCLICHARMLNEKLHILKKRSDEDRERLVASE